VHLTRKAKLGLRTCDGDSELLSYLRSDIQEVASRLHKGGLGYLDDYVDLEEQVRAGGSSPAGFRLQASERHEGTSHNVCV